jgi:hypothetical protein
MYYIRSYLKQTAPPFVRWAVDKMRVVLNGPGVEATALRPYGFEPDHDLQPRLTLVLPSLSARGAFGGVATGLDLAFALAEATGVPLRLVVEQPIVPSDNVLDRYPQAEIHTLADSDFQLPVRRGEVFLLFNWWVSLNIEGVLEGQARYFGLSKRPKIPLIQEYEPQFYPFSAAHLLALEAFNGDTPIWGVFNSTELHDYYVAQGNRCDRAYVFEPRLNAALRPFIAGVDATEKKRILLVYGRPNVPRNAFFLVKRGLEIWAERYGDNHAGWRFLSAGADHAPLRLGRKVSLQSLGKLTLEDYGTLLRQTAIGISLMSSPHPSYPPLEMAHFGARVISNNYANKQLECRHDNIVSLPACRPEVLADTLEAEILAFEARPGTAAQGVSHMPDYLSDSPVEIIQPLARDIRNLMKD